MKDMKVVLDYPPNYQKIQANFNLANSKPVFCYGDVIYNPHRLNLDPFIVAHETVHAHQQEETNPEAWWDKYITDAQFRLSQEIPATRIQYKLFCQNTKDRNEQWRYLHRLASSLASSLYGNMVEYKSAIDLIRQ